MKEIIKKIGITLLVIIAMLLMCCEPKEPDGDLIPYTTVRINGKDYVAEDCGGRIKGKHIDIYFDSHSEALDFGKQKAEVFKKKPPILFSKLKHVKGVMKFASKHRS